MQFCGFSLNSQSALRAYLAEFGIVAPIGRRGVEELLKVIADINDTRVPEVARACLAALVEQLRMLNAHVLKFDPLLRSGIDLMRRVCGLDALPGVGAGVGDRSDCQCS